MLEAVRKYVALTTLTLAAALVACNAILGLSEPTLDNTIGDASTGGDSSNTDSPSTDDVVIGDGGVAAPTQLFNARTRRIALDDASVYYTEIFDNVVGRIGKDGTGQVALANGMNATGFFPSAIALDDTNVFWASVQGIHECAKAGCANAPIDIIDDNSSGNYGPGAISVDATFIYFVNYNENSSVSSIKKVPKGTANGTVTTLVAEGAICATVNHMILYGTYLYYTCDEGAVGRVATSTGTVEVLSASGSPQNADRFVSNGTNIYYSEFIEQATIYQMPITDAAPSNPLALMQAYPNGIDIDPLYLYWVDVGVQLDNGDGTLERCSLSACSTTTKQLVGSIDVPDDIAVDDTYIFYASYGNGDTPNTGVWRLPKPQ
jgi:hypothetical protein